MTDSDTSSVRDKKNELKSRVDKMRERLKNRVDANMFEGIREDRLNHGLKLMYSTPLIGTFADICFCSETQEYLVLESGVMMHRYSMQGKVIRPSYPLGATMLFTKMIWCSEARVSACYIPHDDIIWLLTASCKLLQIIRSEFRIEGLFYSSTKNEIIVVGTNKVTNYSLIDTEHPLNSLQTLSYLDSSCGALWTIEHSTLIDHLPSRLASSYLTTLYILSMEAQGIGEGHPVEFLAKKVSATKAAITTLHYLRSCEWIITGDQQGNILGWNLQLECTMIPPNGHNSQIQIICSHPSICGFITCCEDNILQVWSCNLRGKIESFENLGEIWQIVINEQASSLATLGTKICCFQMHQLYVFYAPLTSPATNLYSTTNPMFPTRIIVSSADNNVRILASRTGKQINVQILPETLEVIGAAYSGILNKMFTIILRTGEILVSTTKTNPIKSKDVWVNDECTITCIIAYEWYEKIQAIFEDQESTINPITTKIVVGTTEGNLVTIDESSGKHESVIPAHIGSVTNLCSSTLSRKIVSVGIDKCVKVWRMFPDIKIPLALICSIYYTVPITHVTLMGSTVCMVSSTEQTKAHQVLMYDSSERIRLDHHPTKDHTELVVALASSESLKIYASSSSDNTIRIWDHQNDLLKILQINTCAGSVIFSSLRGDIVFGAGRHLYKIPYENYLSPKYRARLIVDEIPEDLNEEEVKESDSYRIYDEEVDFEKALHPVSSVPFGSLDTKSSDAPRLELMMLEQLCATLQYRNEDILQIKEGVLKGTRLVADKSVLSHEAWERHIHELLDTSSKITKDIPHHDFWANVDKNAGIRMAYNEPGISRMLYGRSIQSFTDHVEEVRKSLGSPKLPLFGFLPNSVIYKIREEDTRLENLPKPEKRRFKYQYPLNILLSGDQHEDSDNDVDIPLTLSQLAELDGGEIAGE